MHPYKPLQRTTPCKLTVCFQFRAFSSRRSYDPGFNPISRVKPSETVLLGLVEKYDNYLSSINGFISPVSSSITSLGPRFQARVLRSTIDFGIARRWMEYCQSAHAAHDWSRGVLRSTHPQSLRVIDCITLKVVQAPSPCRYVALSYVWGKPEENIDAEDIDALNVVSLKNFQTQFWMRFTLFASFICVSSGWTNIASARVIQTRNMTKSRRWI